MSLYRKYRPQNFSEIIGQEPISNLLLKQLETGKIAHAYLFSGPRGTGKTSTARIFAKALNCEKYKKEVGKFGEPCNKCDNCIAITEGRYLDVMEIDAASNRGIDEIRDLREKIRLAPTTGEFKVYIVDEVHMLTNEAFNALLKTLEEPPEHAVFILATTELHKIPATILSRTQRFQFEKPNIELIEQKLKKISQEEKWTLPAETLKTIAEISEGAFRDAEVLLDKVSLMEDMDIGKMKKFLGRSEDKEIVSLLNTILLKKTNVAIDWLEDFVSGGGNIRILSENILETLRVTLLLKVGAAQTSSKYSPEVLSELKNFTVQISSQKLGNWIKLFTVAVIELKDSPLPSLPLELALVEACEFNVGVADEVKIEENVKVKVPKLEKEETIEVKEVVKPEIKESESVSDPASQGGEVVEQVKPLGPVNKSKGKAVTIEEVQKNWTEVLRKVREINSSLGVFLKSAQPMEMNEDLLIVEVSYRFHKERLEEIKNSTILSETINSLLGRPVRIKGVVNESRPKPVRVEVYPVDEADPVEIFGKLV